jgi:hypothetical protein
MNGEHCRAVYLFTTCRTMLHVTTVFISVYAIYRSSDLLSFRFCKKCIFPFRFYKFSARLLSFRSVSKSYPQWSLQWHLRSLSSFHFVLSAVLFKHSFISCRNESNSPLRYQQGFAQETTQNAWATGEYRYRYEVLGDKRNQDADSDTE